MAKLSEMLEQIRKNEADPEKMKRKEYVGFALGKLCYGSIAKMSSDYLNNYYLSKGIQPDTSGKILFAQKIFDMVNDPIVATIIDSRKNPKKGRFTPFIAPLVPFLAVFSIAMFTIPDFSNPSAVIAWAFMSYMVWESINTFSGVAFDAISTVMSADTQERTLYTTIGNMGGQLAGMVPGLIPVAFDLCTKRLGWSQSTFYMICAILFAVIGGAAGMFTKNLKERIAPEKDNEHFWQNFVLFFKNKELLLLWSTNIPQLISSAASPSTAQFYIHSVGSYSYQALQWVLVGAPQFLAQAFAPFFIKRYRPSRIIFWTTFANGLCFVLMFCIGKIVGYSTPLGIANVLFFATIGWIPSGISGIAQNLLKMNTFDYTAAKTGQRAEATSLMMFNMMGKLLWAIAALIGGIALGRIGFQSDIAGEMQMQTQATKDGLFFIFSMFPAIGNLLGGIPMLFFKLEGPEFERRMAELAAVNAEAAEAKEELEMAE